MSLDVLRRELKEGSLREVYLLFGAEEYLIDKYLKEIEAVGVEPAFKDFNLNKIEGRDSAEKIIQMCDTAPMMSDKKLVIAKDTGLFGADSKNKKEKADASNNDSFIEYLDNKPKEACLVFVEKEVNKSSKLYKAVDRLGMCTEIGFQGEQDLVKWVVNRLNVYDIKINKSDAEYLINICPPDMTSIMNEISKLVDYVGNGKIVRQTDIDEVCIKQLQNKVFDMIDAITKKEPLKAYSLLEDMLILKEPIQKISVLIARHFKNLLYVKEMRTNGSSAERIADQTGMKVFAVNKYIKHSGAFSVEKLKNAARDCLDIDVKVKTGRIDAKIALETFIAKYSK